MKNRQFYRRMLALALPIALQNLLSSGGYLVDTAMVVGLGNIATSGIGVASRWTHISNIAIFGICSGAATLIAQYWGAQDRRNLRRATGLAFFAVAVMSAVYIAVALSIPEFMMKVFTNEASVIEAGAVYIRVSCFTILTGGISLVASTVLRNTEDVNTPFIASTCGVVFNVFFNYCLIYGHFGFPKMGLAGAALATVLAGVVQVVVIMGIAYKKKTVFLGNHKELMEWDKTFVFKYIKLALPVLLNEVFWGIGTNGYSAILARQGSENYSAYTIFQSVNEVFWVFFVGICNACSIMVGKTIGEGKLDEAYQIGKRILVIVMILSVAFGGFQIAMRNPILSLMNIETEGARQTAADLLFMLGLLMPLLNIPYITIVGIFRAGGDIKFGLFADTFSVYCLGIPTLAFLAFKTNVSFLQMVLGMYLAEQVFKNILCIYRFRSKKWIRRIV